MTQPWEPGTQYNYDDVVEYQEHRYKIIQPHRSQSDWTPDITPALWGRLQDSHHVGHHQQQQQQQYEQQQYQQSWQQQQQQQPPSYDYGKQEQGPPPGSDHHKNWLEEHKKALEIGGGLAAGLGLLGAGIGAYKHHEHQKEERGGFEAWANAARSHANTFYTEGPRGPVTWVYNEGKRIPQGAISTGTEHDWTLYIARCWMDESVQLGKASDVFKEGAVIGYRNDEHHVDKYEILLGDMRGLKWVPTSNHLNVDYLGARPVEGGYENDGTPLYVVRAHHKNAWHPGKASSKLEGAFIPYDGKEKCVKEYEVLCYA
ncbi:hypothetical protein AN958_04677 [Leucoagaricus sp. SymC.cos]|nr:hypothetical protein AN958_04677 [Leucoagaricus sp. SymC.cos]